MMTEGESEQFSLRWNNFHSNLTSGFHALLQGEDLVDVTLAAGGQFVQAHKIVLSVCSPYFKELFKVNPCKHPIVILKDVCHKELVAILQFMYQGEVNVRQEELATFLKTAEMLQIKGLTGDDSPSEAESTCSIPTPQASSRQRAPRRMVEKPLRNTPDKAVPLVETVIAEPEEAPTPPPKRLRPEVPSPVSTSSPLVTEEHSSVEMDIRNPKQEPVDYDPDIEEVERIHSRDDTLAQLLGGESSHALQDSSQGPSIFSGIQTASHDSGLQESGQDLGGYVRMSAPSFHGRTVRYGCPKCSKHFSRRDNLRTHIANIHGDARGPFACPRCGKLAKNKMSLRSHLYEYHKGWTSAHDRT